MYSKMVSVSSPLFGFLYPGCHFTSDGTQEKFIALELFPAPYPVVPNKVLACPPEHVEVASRHSKQPSWMSYEEYIGEQPFLYEPMFRERLAPVCIHAEVNDVGVAAYCRGCDAKMVSNQGYWRVAK